MFDWLALLCASRSLNCVLSGLVLAQYTNCVFTVSQMWGGKALQVHVYTFSLRYDTLFGFQLCCNALFVSSYFPHYFMSFRAQCGPFYVLPRICNTLCQVMVHGSQNNSWIRHLVLPHRIVVTHRFHSVPRCCNLHILKLPTVMRHWRIQASKVAKVKTIGLCTLSQPASSVKITLHL